MPQFASRLHPSARPLRGTAVPRAHRSPRDPMWPQDQVLYDNGPVNGTTDAWTINFGYVVSNTFQLNSSDTVTGFDFYIWSVPGDRLQTVDWSVTSQPDGGTTYGQGTASVLDSFLSTNQFGYDIHKETVTGLGVPLSSGTFWFNLQNAVVVSGYNPIYWDENSGVGCNSPGCPSQAVESAFGTIPSEAFDVTGSSSTTITCGSDPPDRPVKKLELATAAPSPTQTFQVIYNFTGGADGAYPATGLAMDAQGNLYGTAGTQWLGGYGTVFKLSPSASGWRFTRLYAFSGTDGDILHTRPALASDGSVYGTTTGGGNYSNGVLFGLSPSGQPLPSIFGNWTQKLLYSFMGGSASDGAAPQGEIVLDASGNVYGTARYGGDNLNGTLYEYTNGSLQVLHAFTGYDGSYPAGVIKGPGGLYGITQEGGTYGAGTMYTLAGGYQVLYNFQDGQYQSGSPIDLAADQAGNLYGAGITFYTNGCEAFRGGTIFELTYPDWTLVPLQSWSELSDFRASVTTDAAGDLYGTNDLGFGDNGAVYKLTCCWTYTTLHQFSGPDGNYPIGKVLIDAKGNIYGTTSSGGAYGYGTVWEISP